MASEIKLFPFWAKPRTRFAVSCCRWWRGGRRGQLKLAFDRPVNKMRQRASEWQRRPSAQPPTSLYLYILMTNRHQICMSSGVRKASWCGPVNSLIRGPRWDLLKTEIRFNTANAFAAVLCIHLGVVFQLVICKWGFSLLSFNDAASHRPSRKYCKLPVNNMEITQKCRPSRA